jgi:hypothetical protein
MINMEVLDDTVAEVVALDECFSIAGVRHCLVNGVRHSEVLKTIEVVTGNTDEGAKSTWNRMKKKHPELVQECVTHDFGGQAQDVIVANASTLMRMFFIIKSARAQAIRDTSAKACLLVRNPTPEFVEALRDLVDLQSSVDDIEANDGVLATCVPRGPRCYGETSIYVRIRCPKQHCRIVTDPKELTMGELKFGVAYEKEKRNSGYPKDNGYFAFAFVCLTRREAEFIESYVKSMFGTLTVFNSREYLDARRLAVELGLQYDGVSYDEYLVVARTLFVKMVEFAKLVSQGNYDNLYGTLYGVAEVVAKEGAPAQLTFPANIITRELAIQFGFRNPTTTWKAIGETAPPKTGRPKSNGTVISCNLVTGEEQQWSSVELGARTLHLEPKNVRSSVDSPRQCGGYVWRTPEAKKWVVPEGLIVDPTKHDGVLAYVKGVDSTGQIVFENKAVAARLLNFSYDSLDNAVGLTKLVGGRVWSFLTESESSTFVDEVDKSSPRATFMRGPDNGANGRTHGKIVARDIATGVETPYDSKNDAATMLGLRGEQIAERLDKPMRALGLVFRRFDATQRWEPPASFKYRTADEKGSPIKFENRSSPDSYVVSIDEAGNVTGLYENKVAAAQLTGISRSSINNLTDTPQTVKGMKWRSAVPEDYMTFVPCEPPRIV